MHRFWNSTGWAKVSLLIPALLLVALAVAGCGGSSTGKSSASSARSLLTATFSGVHKIDSGDLTAALSVDPTGSSVITQPVSVSFGGPFQSRGAKKLPESDFTIAIDFQGHTGKLGILSTGTDGFVSLSGTSYKLPASSFKQLEGGVSSLGGGSSSSSTLSGLGIHPEQWLTHPEVVGTAEIGGVKTDHIHGKLALGPLLSDIAKVLAKASTASSAASSIGSFSAAQQAKIQGEVKNASFDLWTGQADHTIRKLTVSATLPVTGSARTELGGMTSAKMSFELAYSDIGKSQTITAPATSKPYTQFQQALSTDVLQIEELIVGYSSASGTGTTATSSGSTGAGADSSYSQCISAAGGSVAKIQKCATLLNSSGG